jgi:hypothetical protein
LRAARKYDALGSAVQMLREPGGRCLSLHHVRAVVSTLNER